MNISVQEAITFRHSVRSFKKEALSQEQLTELLEAARNAPSSLNSQPWRFKLVTDAADLAWFGTSDASRKQSWLAAAPAIIICCVDLEHYVKDSQSAAFFYRDNDLIQGEPMDGIDDYVTREATAEDNAKFGACAMNTGIAVAFLMLRAVEMGLGTCWVGMFNEKNIKERFAIPEGMRVVSILAVGKPDETNVPERKRKSLEEILL